MIEVELKPLRDVGTEDVTGTDKSHLMTLSTIRDRAPSQVSAPSRQTGAIECLPITTFCYPELAIADFNNAIVTRTGAVIVDERFVIEETVEGSLESNGFIAKEGKYWFNEDDVDLVEGDIISFIKFGIFNYSIFLTEIMPCAYLLSLSEGMSKRKFVMDLPNFMTAGAVSLRWRALGACGYAQDQSLSTSKSGIRANRVGLAKVNDRYKNHRANQLTMQVASVLRAAFADTAAPPTQRIYIHRKGGVARRVNNYDQFSALLHQYQITPIALEEMTIDEQVNLFCKADFVIAEHGAGLVNTMFLRPGSKVIEMFPEPLIGRWAFRLTSHTCKLNYYFNSFEVPDDWKWDKDSINLDISSIVELLNIAQ